MKTIRSTSRRKFLKTTAAVGIALAAPAIISRGALASSGEVNFMGWAGYPELAKTVFPAFEKSTGIKVNFNEQPDQDSMFAQGKLSLQTGDRGCRRADARSRRRLVQQRPDPGLEHQRPRDGQLRRPAWPTGRQASWRWSTASA